MASTTLTSSLSSSIDHDLANMRSKKVQALWQHRQPVTDSDLVSLIAYDTSSRGPMIVQNDFSIFRLMAPSAANPYLCPAGAKQGLQKCIGCSHSRPEDI